MKIGENMLDKQKIVEREAKFLYKFLKKHRCLKEYVDNVLEQNRCNYVDTYKHDLDIIALIIAAGVSIDWSFTWSDTPQGQKFWEKLDREFLSLTHQWQHKKF